MHVLSSPTPLLRAVNAPLIGGAPSRDRTLVRVRPGVYADQVSWRALAPWDRYLARVHAVALTWRDAVFCLESAAALVGLPIFGEPRDVHVLAGPTRSGRRGDVAMHAAADGRDIRSTGIHRLTAPADTTVDLCRVLGPAFGLAVADAFLRGLGADFDVAAHGRRQRNRRGLRMLDWVAPRATATAESPGESVSRAVIEWLGYEAPELQIAFHHEGCTDRADFFWRGADVIGESDGFGKYDAGGTAASRQRFIDEKRREDRLRRHHNGFVRWEWADVMRPESLDAKLRAAGLRPRHPRQPELLATLGRHPRSLPAPR